VTPFLLESPLRVERLTLVTWALPKERLLPLLPSPLNLETIDIPGEGERALLSLFVGRLRFRPFGVSLLPVSHIAYRTYVRYQNKFGTYSLRGVVDSTPLAATVRSAVGFPIQKNDVKIRWEQSGRVSVLGDELALSFINERAPFQVPGFRYLHQAVEGLLCPKISYWLHKDQRIKMVRLEHPQTTPLSGSIDEIRVPWLMETNLLLPEESVRPHSIFFVSRQSMKALLRKEERFATLPLMTLPVATRHSVSL
jgi:hypothetical protein